MEVSHVERERCNWLSIGEPGFCELQNARVLAMGEVRVANIALGDERRSFEQMRTNVRECFARAIVLAVREERFDDRSFDLGGDALRSVRERHDLVERAIGERPRLSDATAGEDDAREE